jgi:hypothetical protein
VDLNLDTLKREILDYLESRDLAVFRSTPGTLEDPQMVLWDSEHHPDYRMFLDAAIKTGVKMILFATREFEAADIDDLLEEIEDLEMDRDRQRDYQTRLRKMRIHEGVTCSLELAFHHNSNIYVYELQPDWYEEFLAAEEEIASAMADESDLDEGDSLGGYYSKN